MSLEDGEGRALTVPVSEDVWFKAVLQRGNRVQVPVLVRWRHRLDPGEVLEVRVSPLGSFEEEDFLARLQKGWRITVPKIVVEILGLEPGQILSVGIFAEEGGEE